MLLNLLWGNLPRVEPVARTIADDRRRSEPDVADSKEDIHRHHMRVTLLHAHDSQTGQGSMSKSAQLTEFTKP
eukprot:508333-Pyramimonas_sp.AAC.1